MSYNTRTNAYRSSNSEIVSGPGTMYNEITRPRSSTKQYNDNTNTHDVTVPYIKVSKSNSTKTCTSICQKANLSKTKSKNSKKSKK